MIAFGYRVAKAIAQALPDRPWLSRLGGLKNKLKQIVKGSP
jgi:hypothetical protein